MTPGSETIPFAARARREPAEAHFRKLGRPHRKAAGQGAEPAAERTPGLFEIYREDEVRTTSTRFCGGDWHWRLSDAEGLILLDTGGYPSERACRQAIAILQESAALAGVSRAG